MRAWQIVTGRIAGVRIGRRAIFEIGGGLAMETEIVESGTDLDDGKSLEAVTGTGDFCLQTRGGENLWMCWQTLTGVVPHLSSQSRGLIRAKALCRGSSCTCLA